MAIASLLEVTVAVTNTSKSDIFRVMSNVDDDDVGDLVVVIFVVVVVRVGALNVGVNITAGAGAGPEGGV